METENKLQYDAYCAFMGRHRETVWRECWRFAKGDRMRCEDMVQEVWIALWLRFDQLRTDVPSLVQRAWLRRLTRSVLVDLYRRSEPAATSITPLMEQTLPAVGVDYAERIDEMLASLTDDEQRLMQMRLDGYDASEIASAFGINANAVYQRVNRIITKLRKQYGTGL